ncbi:hypothetical protein VM1G_11728 [Cytospora mali]|uniref:Uncharacterized protein n=1 Tax=Cytospora mali TaxID=578113 RepID=A0A194W5H0_CYTMA|nr:hypothetical protein VM1G_11728 [Valsa mali]
MDFTAWLPSRQRFIGKQMPIYDACGENAAPVLPTGYIHSATPTMLQKTNNHTNANALAATKRGIQSQKYQTRRDESGRVERRSSDLLFLYRRWRLGRPRWMWKSIAGSLYGSVRGRLCLKLRLG